MKFILILLTTTFISVGAFAENVALIIGGTGEDFKTENFFLKDFERFNATLTKRGFRVVTVFDSAKTQGKFKAVSATNPNIESSIKDVMSNAKEGDQVIILFHTHGSPPYNGVLGHDVLTETNDFNTADLLPYLTQTKARVLVTDLSCYSGATQRLINYDGQLDSPSHYSYLGHKPLEKNPPPLKPETAAKRLCIMTAASPSYVSICSGDKASNSFTGALLDELESNRKMSVEELFTTAREKDRSFTNMPQISSFAKPIETVWDTWLRSTDPSGLRDEIDMQAQACTGECLERQTQIIDRRMEQLAKSFDKNAPTALLKTYSDALKRQTQLNGEMKETVTKGFKELTTLEKYKAYKDWPYSKILFFSDLKNVPNFRFIMKDGKATVPKETPEFLASFGYLPRMMKIEMMLAMDSKETIGQFVKDLELKTGAVQKRRDENRALIKDTARQLLAIERAKYASSFHSAKGNICQSFEL